LEIGECEQATHTQNSKHTDGSFASHGIEGCGEVENQFQLAGGPQKWRSIGLRRQFDRRPQTTFFKVLQFDLAAMCVNDGSRNTKPQANAAGFGTA